VFDVFGYEDAVVYKKYLVSRVGTGLERLVRLQRNLDDDAVAFLRRHFAWPLAVATADDDSVAGALLAKAGMRYRAHLSTDKIRVRDFNYLLYEERAARVGVEPPSRLEKLVLLHCLVRALAWLEEQGLVHEDIAAHNLLWTVAQQEPSVLVLDCDSIRPINAATDDPLFISTDWTDPRVLSGEVPRPDEASTSYAVGLLVGRVLVAPAWRPSETEAVSLRTALPNALPEILWESTRTSAPRPSLARWMTALNDAIREAPETTQSRRPTAIVLPRASIQRGGLSYGLKERLALAIGFLVGAIAAVALLLELL